MNYVYDFKLRELIIFRIVKRSINSIKETTQTNHQFGPLTLHTLVSKYIVICGISGIENGNWQMVIHLLLAL